MSATGAAAPAGPVWPVTLESADCVCGSVLLRWPSQPDRWWHIVTGQTTCPTTRDRRDVRAELAKAEDDYLRRAVAAETDGEDAAEVTHLTGVAWGLRRAQGILHAHDERTTT